MKGRRVFCLISLRLAGEVAMAAMVRMPALLVSVVFALSPQAVAVDLTSFVDPRTGSGGPGFGYGSQPPGPQVPFGLMRVGPDTSKGAVAVGFEHFSGYNPTDTHVRCFSHTHMVGAGLGDYGNIGVMPYSGIVNSSSQITHYAYRSAFKDETVKPGYYSTFLSGPAVRAELTVCGKRTAKHRYSFTGGNEDSISKVASVIVDASRAIGDTGDCSGSLSLGSSVTVDVAANQVHGYTYTAGKLTRRKAGGVLVAFVMSFDTKMSPQHSTWQNGTVTQNSSTATGKCAGAALQFAPGTTSVEVTVAISLVSVAGARANLEAEAQNKSFETCRQAANTAWNEALGVVALGAGDTTSGNDSNARKLYTALYHAQMAPTHVHDFDGKYRGMDGAVHQLQHPATDVYMSDMSIWDIHRTELPLLNLLQPRQGLAVVSSLALMASEGGDIPRWPLADVYTGCMIGNHANAIVLDTAVKAGLASLPEQTWHGLLNAMVAAASNASEPHVARPGLLECDKLGYCPQDKVEGGSAYTLAYAFDDWSISRMAALLNESGVEEHFGATAQRFKNVWNEEKLRFCPRHSDGSWECAVDPELNTWLAQGGKFWTEGNEAQWRWFVPGDPAGLVALFPSPAKFVSELDKFMTEPHSNPSTFLPNGGYWAGNEPDILAPWLFNFAGRQDRTQYHTRWLMDHRYGLGGDGLPGNDDFGTLSSWFAFAAMGLYPLTGSAGYILGSPLFEKVVLPGRNATILAHNQSSSNVYVSSLSLNGVTLQGDEARFISHAALQGARLEFWMSATPPTLL